MIKLGRLELEREAKDLTFKLDELKTGVNDLANHIIHINEQRGIDYIINKVCDHAGGRLIVKKGQAVCPMHDWKLNLSTLQYNNSHECKEKIPYKLTDDGDILIEGSNRWLHNPFKTPREGAVKLRWLNHAAVYIECNGVSLITDPWLLGPAFMTGWWLAQASPRESIDLLRQADFVYVSHNHPDHLHAETLALLPRDKPIITADFRSKSSEKYLRKLGFTQVKALNFLDVFELTPGFQISVLKSGDFRDDSGIYVCANGHELLLTVDANFLNGHVLPRQVDLLMTSFAGGASGFPLCYENYTEEEKLKVINRNKRAIKTNVLSYVQKTSPAHYMPYAGMFSEHAERDRNIKRLNTKNTFEDYHKLLSRQGVKVLKPDSASQVVFENGTLTRQPVKATPLEKENCSYYINKFKEEFIYDSETIINYLKDSGFKGRQVVQIIPTDDAFGQVVNEIVYADFYHQEYKVIQPQDLVKEKEDFKVMQLKIRPEVIMCIIENYLPWEDFSIGFQMRASRYPNVYESDFWFHFTNVYIAKEHFRFSPFCGSCTVINQNPVWIKNDRLPVKRGEDLLSKGTRQKA